MPHATVRTVPELMDILRTIDPTSPRLVWYGTGHERIELSGKVLDNWVAKTSNLLVDELDAEPGLVVDLALPPHWKAVIWALAAWQVGCAVRTTGAPGPAGDNVLATVFSDPAILDTAGLGAGTGIPVAVALGALETSWSGDLPSSGLDFAAEVRSHGDVYFVQGQGLEDAVALQGRTLTRNYAALMTGGTPAEQQAQSTTADSASVDSTSVDSATVLMQGVPEQLDEVLLRCLAAWSAGGCVVLVDPEKQVTERLVSDERVSVRPHLR